MPLKDPDAQRQYQLEWMWRRRWGWILEHGPCVWCGSTENVQVSWKNPARKQVKIASIWSRSQENRDRLLADCEVLCGDCTRKKMSIWRAVRTGLGTKEAPDH